MAKYPDEIILGTPRICPECKQQNPSGLTLPKQCIWCNRKDKENIKTIIREELFCKKNIS
ncbi:MAG: hypothetical protein ACOC2W_00135 [bacterium]